MALCNLLVTFEGRLVKIFDLLVCVSLQGEEEESGQLRLAVHCHTNICQNCIYFPLYRL